MQKIKIAVLALITCLSFSQLAIPAANATGISLLPGFNSGDTIVGTTDFVLHMTDANYGSDIYFELRRTDNTSIATNVRLRFTSVGDHPFRLNPVGTPSEIEAEDSNVFYASAGDRIQMDPGTYSIKVRYETDADTHVSQTLTPVTFKRSCEPGTYSTDGGQPLDNSGCLLATAGHYVATSKATSETECPAGTFQFSSGAMNCTHTQPGTYTSTPASVTATDCAKGTYQPDEQKTSCITSPANFYVSATAATAATACPTNYTSPEGSDSLDDCIAPAPAVTPSIAKGKKKSAKALAVEIGMTVPSKSKVTLKLNKASKKFCKISGSKIKATKFGTCNVTVTVKPKKGTKSVKTTALTVS